MQIDRCVSMTMKSHTFENTLVWLGPKIGSLQHLYISRRTLPTNGPKKTPSKFQICQFALHTFLIDTYQCDYFLQIKKPHAFCFFSYERHLVATMSRLTCASSGKIFGGGAANERTNEPTRSHGLASKFLFRSKDLSAGAL